jgi:tRNA 2-selenouridine synthase
MTAFILGYFNLQSIVIGWRFQRLEVGERKIIMTDMRHIVEIENVGEAAFDEIIDVRSPKEFEEDHIPGAINCPVLDDEQHVLVGTLYKQVSPFDARKVGAALASRNIAKHIEEKFSDKERSWKPLIYCWRGGQRSNSMYTVFRAVGWNAMLLKGGYKSYRSRIVTQLEELPARFNYVVIGGPTGSGKTVLLGIIEDLGAQVLDLEAMAKHKGSVLGFYPDSPKQSQKAFDTQLIKKLSTFDPEKPIFVEAESRKIGRNHLPSALYRNMLRGELIIVDLPMEERVSFLSRDYAWFKEHLDVLKEKLLRLKGIRGKKVIERWFEMIDAQEWGALIEDLLNVHYDPLYVRSSKNGYTDQDTRHVMPCAAINELEFKKLARDVIKRFG